MKFTKIINLFLISLLFFFSLQSFLPSSLTEFFFDSCNRPLTFQLKDIDSHFNLKREDAIKYLNEAANLWNEKLAKQVLKYDENGEVEISFVFDERQRKTIQNNILKERAKKQSNYLSTKETEIQIKKDNFEKINSEYEDEVKIFEKDLYSYNQKVALINSSGGATKEEAEMLQQEKDILLNRKSQIENRRREINKYLLSINSQVKSYNNNIDEVNSVIEEINKNSLGEFEQGHYSNKEIILYEYEDTTTLKRLLAHELGHALGLGHTSSTDSIMYYINEGDKFILTDDDVEEYKKVCK